MIEYLSGPVEDGERVLIARTRTDVGIEQVAVDIPLGPWPPEAPGPAGPLGLASTPVVILPNQVWTDLAIAGAMRAGRIPSWVRLAADAPLLAMQMLVAVTDGADVIFVEDGCGSQLRAAGALGARPLPVLPLPDVGAIADMLAGCDIDVNIPVPAVDEPSRSRIHELLAPLELEALHHLVEVDPAPAFLEANLDMEQATLEAMAAGAAGVLAGRLAVSNRRWRAQLQA